FVFLLTSPSTSAIYTLSLHDALPIFSPKALATMGEVERIGNRRLSEHRSVAAVCDLVVYTKPQENTYDSLYSTSFLAEWIPSPLDRKSTRLNSSHLVISYAVFCLKKK